MAELTSSDLQAFKDLEQTGWEDAASIYDPFLGIFTLQAVDRLLDASHVGEGMHILDVACGPGYAAGQAADRGATVIGIDFASAMVAEASRHFPKVEFRQGDAQALPFTDESFGAVISNFGMLHFAEPDKAIAEAYRVLASGGRFAFTVWCDPTKGPSYFSLLFGSMQAHANMDVSLPPAPPLFRFSNHDECCSALTAAGFVELDVSEFAVIWRPTSVDMLLEFIQKCAVRGRMLIDLQHADIRERIYNAIRDGAKQFEHDEKLEIPWPAVLATARKP